jgi:hypothetical protein
VGRESFSRATSSAARISAGRGKYVAVRRTCVNAKSISLGFKLPNTMRYASVCKSVNCSLYVSEIIRSQLPIWSGAAVGALDGCLCSLLPALGLDFSAAFKSVAVSVTRVGSIAVAS